MAHLRNDALYPLVQKAIEYACENSSSYMFINHLVDPDQTIDRNSLYKDRIEVNFKRGDLVEVTCQIVFDSKDYLFPPDIIFTYPKEYLSEFDKFSLLLPPHEWDLTRIGCLHNWLQIIWKVICEYSSIGNSSQEKQKHSTSFLENSLDEYKEEESNSDYTDAVSTHSLDLSEENTHSKEQKDYMYLSYIGRKEIIEEWVPRIVDNLVWLDIDSYLSISFYISVEIPDEVQENMVDYQEESYSKFTQQIAKAHTDAPVLVKVDIPIDYPSSPLKFLLVSAVNTELDGVCEPDSYPFVLTPSSLEPSKAVDEIMETLVVIIPIFHTQQFDKED
ncbi:hypothetical protein J3Q64DRAFT_1439521 [Phycomyces blakesleeanus]|uniref:Brain and reproductive organ-expressed protein n=1 Tax=Phycomyces blakesleeanus TaxID=4837 RepID=A0ABR3B3E5_PHYBL